jgi:hypothetical protein
MKGVTIRFECAWCGKTAEVEGRLGLTLKKAPGWVQRGIEIGTGTARLYPAWKGSSGDDVLPRLFCGVEHMAAFNTAEAVAKKQADKEGLVVARRVFADAMRTAKLGAMDAVSALATVVERDNLVEAALTALSGDDDGQADQDLAEHGEHGSQAGECCT